VHEMKSQQIKPELNQFSVIFAEALFAFM